LFTHKPPCGAEARHMGKARSRATPSRPHRQVCQEPGPDPSECAAQELPPARVHTTANQCTCERSGCASASNGCRKERLASKRGPGWGRDTASTVAASRTSAAPDCDLMERNAANRGVQIKVDRGGGGRVFWADDIGRAPIPSCVRRARSRHPTEESASRPRRTRLTPGISAPIRHVSRMPGNAQSRPRVACGRAHLRGPRRRAGHDRRDGCGRQ